MKSLSIPQRRWTTYLTWWRERRRLNSRRRIKDTIILPARPGGVLPAKYLGVVAIIKNEGRYLREWLAFQRLMGAEHVFLYDNGSTDNSVEIVQPFVKERFATLIPWTTFDLQAAPQRQAYAHALCNYGPEFYWMAFIDLDEFLFPVTAPNLVTVLAQYEDCPALCVPWFIFGTSGHETPPPGLVIENYTERAPFPPPPGREKLIDWKSIVQPEAVVGVSSVHAFDLACGITGGVDEARNQIVLGRLQQPPSGGVLRINHYFTRSSREFAAKLCRSYSPATASLGKARRKRQARLQLLEDNLVHDETILRFTPELRDMLNAADPAWSEASIRNFQG